MVAVRMHNAGKKSEGLTLYSTHKIFCLELQTTYYELVTMFYDIGENIMLLPG
jgi:hypothetical protein